MMMRYLLHSCSVDEGAHGAAMVQPISALVGRHMLNQHIRKFIIDFIVNKDPIRTNAGLPCIAKLCSNESSESDFKIGILEDDEGGVTPVLKRQL
jgi:hypothetical protein